jgi:sarcosine oxidase
MGSAAAFHLSSRGCSVIGFEQFNVVHEMGSHSGATRIIRHAYFESPDYVPLVIRADQLWCELEASSGIPLLIRTGGIDAGPSNSTLFQGALLASRTHHLPHEVLSAAEMMNRWPQFQFPEDWQACYDPKMGFLLVDDCIRVHVDAARRHHALIQQNETVQSFEPTGSTIRIKTDRNDYEVSRLVVCAGAWANKILKDLGLPLVVKRKTLSWLRPSKPDDYSPERFPIFLAQTSAGVLYGFPIYGKSGVKIANHHSGGAAESPDDVDRTFHESDADDIKSFAKEHLPGILPEVLDGKVCLYTLTPDEDFVIDLHPSHKNVVIAAGFSGHGFKFAPTVGEILADLCLTGTTNHPIQRFRIERFERG